MKCPCCGHEVDATGVDALKMIRLGGQESAILGELVRLFPRGTSHERMHAVLYGDRSDGGPDFAYKIVHLIIMRVRQKIRAHGWTIPDGRTEGGYRLVRL